MGISASNEAVFIGTPEGDDTISAAVLEEFDAGSSEGDASKGTGGV